MQNKEIKIIKNGREVDKNQCVHYGNDMKICTAGFGRCGTKGRHSYSARCGTSRYLSIERFLKESGHL